MLVFYVLFAHYVYLSLDVDECFEDLDNCDGNATCTDTDGSFNCTCNTGYSGSGVEGGCSGMFHQKSVKVNFFFKSHMCSFLPKACVGIIKSSQ